MRLTLTRSVLNAARAVYFLITGADKAQTARRILILHVTVTVDGQQAEGVSADHLAPRWFVKDPRLTLEWTMDCRNLCGNAFAFIG